MENGMLSSMSNATLCNWTYGLFVWQSIMAALAIFTAMGTIFMWKSMGIPKSMAYLKSFVLLLTAGIAVASALFLYLICDRALLSPDHAQKA